MTRFARIRHGRGNCGYAEEIQESSGQARLLGLNRRRIQSNLGSKKWEFRGTVTRAPIHPLRFAFLLLSCLRLSKARLTGASLTPAGIMG